MTAPPVHYTFRRCPYAIRARLALGIAGVAYERREVSLRAKPRAMLAASPKGTVPVMVLSDGRVLEQSLDIMRWALAHRDPENWLARDDAALVAANDGAFKRHLDGYKYPERHGGDPRTHRDAATGFLRTLDTRIAGDGQLCGARRGFADAAILPFVRQFAAVDRAWFDAAPFPALRGWLAAHLASDLFGAVMTPAARWDEEADAAPPVAKCDAGG